MEPITHFLTGACLARSGFNRKTALATATMTLAAEAPDIDILGSFKDPVFGFAHHRGFTHSFLGLIMVEAVVVGLMYFIWRVGGRKVKGPQAAATLGLAVFSSYIATDSHPARFHQQLRRASVVAVFGEVVLLGHRVHRRASDSHSVDRCPDPALVLFLINDEIGARRKGPNGRLAAALALLGMVALWNAAREHRRDQRARSPALQ